MLSFNQLIRNLKRDCTGFHTLRVALIGDSATQLLAKALCGMSIERSFQMHLFEAAYNQVERQFMDPSSELYEFNADIIVVFQSTHKLGEYHSGLPIEGQASLADERLSFVASICENPSLANKKIIYFFSFMMSITITTISQFIIKSIILMII